MRLCEGLLASPKQSYPQKTRPQRRSFGRLDKSEGNILRSEHGPINFYLIGRNVNASDRMLFDRRLIQRNYSISNKQKQCR